MSDSVDETKRKPGRPHGARNKSSLMKAQVKIDDLTLYAVEHLKAFMENDKSFLNCGKENVPFSIRFNATKEILAKGIANEKEKDAPKPMSNTTTDESGDKVHTGPQVFSTAV